MPIKIEYREITPRKRGWCAVPTCRAVFMPYKSPWPVIAGTEQIVCEDCASKAEIDIGLDKQDTPIDQNGRSA